MQINGAPDPVRFIDKYGAYLNFVAKAEKDDTIKELLIDENFEKILKEFRLYNI
ncbi:hypothetical protein [Asaccharospora irregularis]|uniref:Uncharacterized protein n=1 Tax=Asaccharospora irregularis DSM 2635 TaxID=1121321 RepID=A0A1M5LWQ4_9FIRM|nr:hypothetical protein [Asaccharospora irregularis]SHG69350.1 hypothetical protein SAMN04488530_105111 [Asaccharospora irregularis DSM 2635]